MSHSRCWPSALPTSLSGVLKISHRIRRCTVQSRVHFNPNQVVRVGTMPHRALKTILNGDQLTKRCIHELTSRIERFLGACRLEKFAIRTLSIKAADTSQSISSQTTSSNTQPLSIQIQPKHVRSQYRRLWPPRTVCSLKSLHSGLASLM
jgi:hypothetical protein